MMVCSLVPHLNNAIIIVGAGLLAAAAAFVTNWLALMPWRRSKTSHWSEQARLVFPVCVAARSNLWSIPGGFALTVVLLWPASSPLWLFAGMAAFIGTHAATLLMDRELYARIPFHELLRQVSLGFLMRFLIWFIFIGATVLMPDEFDQLSLCLGGLVIGLWMLWSNGVWLWVWQKLGLIAKPPERLQKIAAAMSSRMNIPFRHVWLLRSPLAQAYAMPAMRQILFTERLLELMSDDEIAVICSHELAHLSEPKSARYARSIQTMAFMPLLFFNPLIHHFGMFAFFGLLFSTIGIPRIFSKISRKLETRADQMAQANEVDAGTYAKALAKLYEDGLLPVVNATNRATHPHLYDRMLAAGVTPDFPRPAPAAAMAWNGHLFATIVGILFAVFVMSHFDKWLNPPPL